MKVSESMLPPNLPRLSLKTPADVAVLFEETINQVRQGQMDPRTANTIRQLANGLLRALQDAARQAAQAHSADAGQAAGSRNVSDRKPLYYAGELSTEPHKPERLTAHSFSPPPGWLESKHDFRACPIPLSC